MPISQLAVGTRQQTKLEAGVQKLWLNACPLLEALPKVTNGSLQVRHKRQLTAPTPGTRKLYGAFTESYGGSEIVAFDLPIYGGYLRIDEQLLSEPGGLEEWADQTEAYNTGFAFRLNNDAVNGDRAVDPEAMDGLKIILAGMPSRQTIVPTTAIDLTTSALRKTNAPELLRYFDLAFQRIRQGTGGNPNVILMDDDLTGLLADAMRQSGFLDQGRDSIEREFKTWKGARIIEGGFKYAEALTQSSAVIGANHDGDGNTSVYFLRGGPEYVHWIQKHALKITEGKTANNGSTDDDLVVRTKMEEWPIAMRSKHPYGAVRLTKIDITP